MDTTELLGGFEQVRFLYNTETDVFRPVEKCFSFAQADIGRHIEQVTDECDRIVRHLGSHLLVTSSDDDVNQCQRMLKEWHKLKTIDFDNKCKF